MIDYVRSDKVQCVCGNEAEGYRIYLWSVLKPNEAIKFALCESCISELLRGLEKDE